MYNNSQREIIQLVKSSVALVFISPNESHFKTVYILPLLANCITMCNEMVTVEIREFSLEFCPNYDYFPPPNAREIMTIWTMGKSSYSLISTVFDKTT